MDTIKININEILNQCKDMNYDDEVKVINICNFTETIYPDFFSNIQRYRIREEAITGLIRKYDKLFHYYAAPRESFFVGRGIREAKEKNLKFVIVEDMS